jgi:hypothetical protein
VKHIQPWHFITDGEGKWRWRCQRPEHPSAESRDGFHSRADCIADAMRHGYLAREPGRQPETQATELF